MSGLDPNVATDGRSIDYRHFGIGGNPTEQRGDYTPSGTYLAGANDMMQLEAPFTPTLVAPFDPDLGETWVAPFDPDLGETLVAPFDPDLGDLGYTLEDYGDDGVLYGLAEGLFDKDNLVMLALTGAAAWAGYTYGPEKGYSPLVGAVSGALAFSGARVMAGVVKQNAFSELTSHPLALAGLAGGGWYAWSRTGEPLPAALGGLAGLAVLGGSLRKAIEEGGA